MPDFSRAFNPCHPDRRGDTCPFEDAGLAAHCGCRDKEGLNMQKLYVCQIRITGEDNPEADKRILADQITRLTPEDFEIGHPYTYPFRARLASCIDAWATSLLTFALAAGGAYAMLGPVFAGMVLLLFAMTSKNREHFLTDVQSKYEARKAAKEAK